MHRSKQHFSFDDPVGADEEHWRNAEAERFGGLQIDDQFEFGRLHDRQFRRPRPFENSTGIDTSKAPSVRNAGFVANQAAASDKFPSVIDGRNAMLRCQGDELVATLEQEWIRTDQKHTGAVLNLQATPSRPAWADAGFRR